MSKKKKTGKKPPANPAPAGKSTVGNKARNPEKTANLPSTSPATTPQSNPAPSEARISRYVSFGLLLGVIVLVSILFYEVMAQFLIPLFLAALLVVVFRPLHRWILEKCRGREKLAALLTTASVLLVVLIPIGTLLVMAAAEGRHFYNQFNAAKIVDGVRQARSNMKLDMPSKSELRTIDDNFSELQNSITLSAAEEYSHRTALYDIEVAGKKLASEQGLDWPSSSISAEQPPTNESDWYLFATSLVDARALQAQVFALPDKDSSDKDSSDKDASDKDGADKDAVNKESADGDQSENRVRIYQAKLNEAADYFSYFKTTLLGGKTRAWAVELFNPSDAEAEGYANSVVSILRDRLFRLTGAGVAYAGNLLLSTAIMIIGLYFFLLDGPKMIQTFKGLSPIDDEHEQELVTEFGNVSRAVVLATLLSALAQGLLAGIGFYFAGLDSVFLLTVLSAMLAMVPFVGAAAVWVPCCLYLGFIDNNLTAAIGLGIYGAAVISMADNVIKPFVLHGQSNIHPLFALLSVLGGVSTLGPIGIVIGPMVVAFLQTLLRILQREMMEMDQLSHQPDGS